MRSICLLMFAVAAYAEKPTTGIKVDQAGYLNQAPKVALVSSKTEATEYTVRAVQGGAVAFKGRLAAAVDDPDSGDHLQAADFSRLTRSGRYYLEAPGIGRSWEFAVGPGVYSRAWYLACSAGMRSRCPL